MARRSGGSRPAPRAAAAQQRSNTTAAAPQQARGAAPAAAAPPAAAGGGMFANMASTAAGVAVGSTVGHGLSNMLFGGSSSAAAQEAPAPAAYAAASAPQENGASCSVQAKDFTKCLDATNDMNSCSYYLDALKACQSAAAPY